MYLALMLSVLSAFIVLFVQTVRTYTSRSEAVYAVDNAVRSCFAEYNRELYNRFHILLIDSSYKRAENGSRFTEGHFMTYLQNSITGNEICHAGMTGYKSAGSSDRYLYDAAVAYAKEELCIDPRLSVSGDMAHFITYILSVCGSDSIPGRPSYRRGEIEYLLYGSENDNENIMWAHEDAKAGSGEEGEAAYEEYLCSALERAERQVLLERFSSLVTEYMRENGSPGFDLNECYYDVSFLARLKDRSGSEYSVERAYAYAGEGI